LTGNGPTTLQVNVTLPAGVSLVKTAVGAANALVIGPGDSVTGSLASGGGPAVLLPDATTGSVEAVDNVKIGPGVRVKGSVAAGGTIERSPFAVVSGSSQAGENLTASTVSWTVNDPGNSQGDITLHDSATAAPSPGVFGNVFVDHGSTVYLQTGTYFFNGFDLEQGGNTTATNLA